MIDFHKCLAVTLACIGILCVDQADALSPALFEVVILGRKPAAVVSIVLDCNGGACPTGISSGSANTTATISTANGSDEVCILAAAESVSGGTIRTVSSVAGAGLTWAQRAAIQQPNSTFGAHLNMETWCAPAASALSGQVITVTWSGAYDDACMVAWGVHNQNVAAPFDTNGSIPGTATVPASTGTAATIGGISVSSPSNTFVIGAVASPVTNDSGDPAGFTRIAFIQNGNGTNSISCLVDYLVYKPSAATITWPNVINAWSLIVDAIKS
jgi:hypothetical protein